MFHKAHPFCVLLALTGIALFLTALPCRAAGHGGGFGGNHGYAGVGIRATSREAIVSPGSVIVQDHILYARYNHYHRDPWK